MQRFFQQEGEWNDKKHFAHMYKAALKVFDT